MHSLYIDPGKKLQHHSQGPGKMLQGGAELTLTWDRSLCTVLSACVFVISCICNSLAQRSAERTCSPCSRSCFVSCCTSCDAEHTFQARHKLSRSIQPCRRHCPLFNPMCGIRVLYGKKEAQIIMSCSKQTVRPCFIWYPRAQPPFNKSHSY